jgi:hypothetical protein
VPWRRIARREEGRDWGRGGRDQGKQGRLYADGLRMCIEVRQGAAGESSRKFGTTSPTKLRTTDQI